MSDGTRHALWFGVGALVYCSSLLLWPLHLLFRRRRKKHGKAMLIVWLFQLAIYGFIFADIRIPLRILEHGYNWLVILPFLNIALGFASALAWICDGVYEREHPLNCK